MHKLLTLVALLAVALAGTFGAAIPAAAATITITNPSFENPAVGFTGGVPTDWTLGGTGGAGVWNINDMPFTFWTVPAPDGKQIAFISNNTGGPGSGSPASISQVLGDSLLAGSFYSLTGYVGHPSSLTYGDFSTLYTVELLAGVNVLNTVGPATGPSGTFGPFLLTFNSTGSSYVGLPLGIRLSSAYAQTGFDNIGLNVTAVPEPEIYAMLAAGLGLIGFVARRRQRYGA